MHKIYRLFVTYWPQLFSFGVESNVTAKLIVRCMERVHARLDAKMVVMAAVNRKDAVSVHLLNIEK